MESGSARKQFLNIDRGFERSRVEEELMSAAYEWAVPILRQPLPAAMAAKRKPGKTANQPQPATGGGCT